MSETDSRNTKGVIKVRRFNPLILGIGLIFVLLGIFSLIYIQVRNNNEKDIVQEIRKNVVGAELDEEQALDLLAVARSDYERV